jgi:hypothetical protein
MEILPITKIFKTVCRIGDKIETSPQNFRLN